MKDNSRAEIQKIRENIKEAELVLVGIGEEFSLKETDGRFNKEEYEVRMAAYQGLQRLLQNKNYFVVTLCTDGMIRQAGLKDERIVEPCGSYYRLQCANKCTDTITVPDEDLQKKIKGMFQGREEKMNIERDLPVCGQCGKKLIWNTIETENYAEEGYLEQWKAYTKWLQETVNHKVCLLELGTGMKFPTVIRWPFEKITYFNNKASLIRIHSRLFQTTEEIKDRSTGIEYNPVEFVKELSIEV